MRILAVLLAVAAAASAQGHLLISEVCVTPTEGEFVEVHNPTNSTVFLDCYYLCDLYGTSASVNSFYPRLVAGQITSNVNDFCVQFPAGASIPAGGTVTIAISGTAYQGEYGEAPDFDILNTGTGTPMTIPPNGYVGSAPGLTNGDEVVVLFYWNGSTDVVYDVDYALWGDDTTRRVVKDGISLDGPDAGSTPTPYLNDTPAASQSSISLGAHAIGESYQRTSMTETGEVASGGNGLAGHDETSEDLAATWVEATPTPGYIYTGLARATWGGLKWFLHD